jgi:hypothetical protein
MRALSGKDPGDGAAPNVTPQLQAEYERAAGAMETVLYKNEKSAHAIKGALTAQDKVGSVVAAVLLVLKLVDQQINMNEEVIAQIVQDTCEEVMQIAEATLRVTFTNDDSQHILAAAWQGALKMFGGDGSIQDDYTKATAGMQPGQVQQANQMSQEILPQGGQQPAGGAPDQAQQQPPAQPAAPAQQPPTAQPGGAPTA